MRLQEVLKERESEISTLEKSLRESQASQHSQAANGSASVRSTTPTETTAATTPDTEQPPAIEKSVTAANGHVTPEAYLSPQTMHQFDNIRRSMQFTGQGGVLKEDESGSEALPDDGLARLNDLMLCVLSVSIQDTILTAFLVLWPRKKANIEKLSTSSMANSSRSDGNWMS